MATIIQATQEHLPSVRDLFWEYLQWANGAAQQEFGVTMDSAAQLENDMQGIAKYMPPDGRLLLALDGSVIVGCACLRTHHPHIAELKRMYMRPSSRRHGFGRALVAALITDIQEAGYTTLRLDSARFMQQAHALYRSMGFQEVAPYPESEIPPDLGTPANKQRGDDGCQAYREIERDGFSRRVSERPGQHGQSIFCSSKAD